MRTMKMLTLLALVAIIAVPVMAKTVEKTSWRTGTVASPFSRDLAEGFEGDFPAAGWTIDSPSGHTGELNWSQGPLATESVYAGEHIAQVNYDPALAEQDCRLSFDYTITEDEDHLNFAVAASAYWMINYTMNVLIDGTPVFDLATAYGEENWVYEIHDIDLATYVGQTVTITFQYLGADGAALYLDEVGVNNGIDTPPPPEAPENDLCDGAIAIPAGVFSFEGDLTEANGDYDTAGSDGCTGYSAAGNDVVYVVTLQPGDQLDVSYTNAADGNVYLITDCDDSPNSCLVGADDTLSGDAEVITYANDTAEALTAYLICDAYGAGNGGAFTLTGELSTTVATESHSWTTVKGLFQ